MMSETPEEILTNMFESFPHANALAQDVILTLEANGLSIEQDWCYDMEKAPRDGTVLLGIVKGEGLVIQWGDGMPLTNDAWCAPHVGLLRDSQQPTAWKPITPPNDKLHK